MNKLHALILSAFCATTFITHASTHEELLRYDLAQRKTTQKIVVNLRNVAGVAALLGLLTKILIEYQNVTIRNQYSMYLNEPQNNSPKPLNIPFYLAYALDASRLCFIPSLVTFFTSALYGIYNGMHIETLEQELNRLNTAKETE